MSRADADAMRRYEAARDELAALLHGLAEALGDERRAAVNRVRASLLRGRFVLAVVGEFSSGKSYLLNALLEKFNLLATDVNPSTAAITELEFGDRDEASAVYEDGRSERIPLDVLNRFIAVGASEVGRLHEATGDAADVPVRVVVKANSPFLQRGFVVADTPGLASINPAHRRATLQYLPTADAVLYLIDTQQPFTEGDAAFLGIVRRHIDTIFIVQTKIDLWEQPQSDGRPAWEHAYDRIARLTAIHAPGTYVYALSARDYVQGRLNDDRDAMQRSRFSAFVTALDASLVRRSGRARLRRAVESATSAAHDERASIDADVAAIGASETVLHEKKAAIVPQLQALDERARAYREALLSEATLERRALDERGGELAGELERALAHAFDTADVARLRDRERLHLIVDHVVADVAGEFARGTADAAVADWEDARAKAAAELPLRWSANDAAAHAFGAHPGSTLWSGDVRDAIAASIVLEAIGGPSIALVQNVAARFAGRPPGTYMKRELIADLRAQIFPRLRAEVLSFAGDVGSRLQRVYDDLAHAIGKAVMHQRDAGLGSIERALRAHADGTTAALTESLQARRAAIERRIDAMETHLASFMEHQEEIEPADPGPENVRMAHADASFDPASYREGLSPQRWRVAVLGALRRGKSSLINAFANERVLTDDDAGSVRFPVHVRYGEPKAAFALDPQGHWSEIPFETAASHAAETAVLVLVPWKLPRELVLVHAPAFDSGDPDADDVNVAVASHASEVLCLFSRQLSDRELDLYERIAEFGRPMLFAHTIADNESSSERRHVVELAQKYLHERSIDAERVFTISAQEFAQARAERRAAAAWNETEALRATLEAHAETHMARLERLAKVRAAAHPERVSQASPAVQKRGLLERLLRKGAPNRRP